VPLPDFFALPWGATYKAEGRETSVKVNSQPVVVAPKSGLNCFREMPFRKKCKITLQNLHPESSMKSLFPNQFV